MSIEGQRDLVRKSTHSFQISFWAHNWEIHDKRWAVNVESLWAMLRANQQVDIGFSTRERQPLYILFYVWEGIHIYSDPCKQISIIPQNCGKVELTLSYCDVFWRIVLEWILQVHEHECHVIFALRTLKYGDVVQLLGNNALVVSSDPTNHFSKSFWKFLSNGKRKWKMFWCALQVLQNTSESILVCFLRKFGQQATKRKTIYFRKRSTPIVK